MDCLKPMGKNFNNFHPDQEHEPYGQLQLFEGLNSQTLPPLTRLGAAKTQNSRASDAVNTHHSSNRLPSSAYNPFFAPPGHQWQKLDVDDRPFTALHSSEISSNTNFRNAFEKQSLLAEQRTKDERPATATAVQSHNGFCDYSFKLPPIEKSSNRGPLNRKESNEPVRARRPRKNLRQDSLSEVSKMVQMFETEKYRPREEKEKLQSDDCSSRNSLKKQRTDSEKEGLLAKRCKKFQNNNIHKNIKLCKVHLCRSRFLKSVDNVIY